MKIALLGNPNCGKTTLFNQLTGANQQVGNWPGVTVEKKEGILRGNKDITIIDLPGIYSLSPYSSEEIITRNFLIHEKCDLVINIIDSTNIERSLYLTTQLLELNIHVVIVLNMIDILTKKGITIQKHLLSQKLDCDILEISALKNTNILNLIAYIKNRQFKMPTKKAIFSLDIEELIKELSKIHDKHHRFYSIKQLENDALLNKENPFLAQTKELEEKYQDDIESIIASERYLFIDNIKKDTIKVAENMPISRTDKIDNIILNKWLALPIFFLVMFVIYYFSIQSIGNKSIELMDLLMNDWIGENLRVFLERVNTSPWLIGLVVDGIIGGIGAVLGFLPQLAILFFFISILESTGYMSRVAFILDRIFKRVGLSGKTVIPMIIGTGCIVPGVMASRTIEDETERKMTITLTPFMPCGAKLPVFALFVGIFFPDNPFIAPLLYFISIVVILLSALILKTFLFKKSLNTFIMELPEYKAPNFNYVVYQIYDKVKSFIIRAGTVILAASAILWLLQSFNFRFELVHTEESILASIGKILVPIFKPLGFHSWELSVSLITGILAKEQTVATLEILNVDIQTYFTVPSAMAYMLFTLLASPCIAAIGAMKKEFASIKYTLYACLYQTTLAFIVSLLVYQIGKVFI